MLLICVGSALVLHLYRAQDLLPRNGVVYGELSSPTSTKTISYWHAHEPTSYWQSPVKHSSQVMLSCVKSNGHIWLNQKATRNIIYIISKFDLVWLTAKDLFPLIIKLLIGSSIHEPLHGPSEQTHCTRHCNVTQFNLISPMYSRLTYYWI